MGNSDIDKNNRFIVISQKLILIHYSGHRKKVCEQLYQVSLTIYIDLTVQCTLPGHTKSYFAKYDILTIKNVIVLNALVFMQGILAFST